MSYLDGGFTRGDDGFTPRGPLLNYGSLKPTSQRPPAAKRRFPEPGRLSAMPPVEPVCCTPEILFWLRNDREETSVSFGIREEETSVSLGVRQKFTSLRTAILPFAWRHLTRVP